MSKKFVTAGVVAAVTLAGVLAACSDSNSPSGGGTVGRIALNRTTDSLYIGGDPGTDTVTIKGVAETSTYSPIYSAAVTYSASNGKATVNSTSGVVTAVDATPQVADSLVARDTITATTTGGVTATTIITILPVTP